MTETPCAGHRMAQVQLGEVRIVEESARAVAEGMGEMSGLIYATVIKFMSRESEFDRRWINHTSRRVMRQECLANAYTQTRLRV